MSIDLTQFFPQVPGAQQNIEAKALAYKIIGTGSFGSISNASLNFTGSGSVFGDPFKITLVLKIVDDNNCAIALNGALQNATYVVNSSGYLVITIPDGPEKGDIQVIAGDGGSYIYLDIPSGHDVWIGPTTGSRRELYVNSHAARSLVS